MIEVVAIPKNKIQEVWDQAEPVVAKVLPHNMGKYTTDDVLNDIEAGDSLLLLVLERGEILATIICTFEEQEGKKVLHMPIVCGERIDEWADLCHETVPKIAKEFGCAMVTGRGRRGWLRKLSKYGYEELYTVFGVEV